MGHDNSNMTIIMCNIKITQFEYCKLFFNIFGVGAFAQNILCYN